MKTVCPSLNIQTGEKIQLAHGGGGRLMQELIRDIIYPAFDNSILQQAHDGAVINDLKDRIAITTDSFVVDPLFFEGGNIGDLAINGTVNDLSCCGAEPKYLTASFIIEEGFSIDNLKKIVETDRKSVV